MGVIEAAVTCHLPAYEAGLLKSLIFGAQLYLRHYQTVILAMKLIHLPCMNAVRGFNQITGLVYNARLTYQHQVLSILQGNLAFELIAGKAGFSAGPLDGQISLVVPNPYTNGPAVPGGDIPLPDMRMTASLVLELANNQELPFYLKVHNTVLLEQKSRTGKNQYEHRYQCNSNVCDYFLSVGSISLGDYI